MVLITDYKQRQLVINDDWWANELDNKTVSESLAQCQWTVNIEHGTHTWTNTKEKRMKRMKENWKKKLKSILVRIGAN